MKSIRITLCAALLALGSPVMAAGEDHDHDDAPRHGGVVVEANHLVYELVAAPEVLRLHLRDHGKPVAVEGGQARLTVLDGQGKREIALKPVEGYFEGSTGGSVAAGAKLVAVVQRAGKQPATVRFVLR